MIQLNSSVFLFGERKTAVFVFCQKAQIFSRREK